MLEPAVTTIRRLPAPPAPGPRHTTAESDAHHVEPHSVCPVRADKEPEASPMLVPRSVTLTEPVAGRLAMLARLIATWSIVIEAVRLATAAPQLVRATATLPVEPHPTKDRIDVSDTQADLQRLVYLVLPATVCTASPMLMPCMVTLTEPVAAMLGPDTALVAMGSVERAALMLA